VAEKAPEKPRPLVAVTLAHGSLRERATQEQLERLLARYDLRPWLFTRAVVIDDLAIPHSHPVLTLHTRHLGSDDQLLSTFLHEQLHHFETAHHEETASALAALEEAFPGLPVGFPEGAGTRESSYLHMIVNHLEYESLVRVVGKARADDTFAFWEGDHYRAIYRAERLNRRAVHTLVEGAGLLPPLLAGVKEAPPERFDLPPLEADPHRRAARGAVDEGVLSEILREAEQTRSTSLLVLRGDELVAERTFGGPRDRLVQTMSVTKSFAAIAIGFLLTEKKIPSLETPLSKYIPAFAAGEKAKITLRHVLSHTSGIEHGKGAQALDQSPDRVAYVSKLPVVTEPGKEFSYNNEASALLTAVVAKAAGVELDVYVAKKLFAPLGISHYTWAKDAAGHACSYYGLSLSARDLAKVGLVLARGGVYEGREVVPRAWLEEATRPARPDLGWMGQLIWIERSGPFQVQTSASLAAYAPPGVPLAKLAPLNERRFGSRAEYWAEAGALLSPAERDLFLSRLRDDRTPFTTTAPETIGYRMDGWLGQLLLWYPKKNLVVVRQHAYAEGDEKREVGFASLVALAPKLVR